MQKIVKKYYQNHKEERKQYKEQYAIDNLEKLRDTQKRASKKWQSKNREYLREYDKKRYWASVEIRLKNRLRTDINDCLSGRKNRRHWQDLVGYTLEQLKTHIESQFQPGMTWDNWGRGENCWHIDHKTPQSWFDFSNEEQVRQCWRLENLTCKWESDNLSKGNRSEG